MAGESPDVLEPHRLHGEVGLRWKPVLVRPAAAGRLFVLSALHTLHNFNHHQACEAGTVVLSISQTQTLSTGKMSDLPPVTPRRKVSPEQTRRVGGLPARWAIVPEGAQDSVLGTERKHQSLHFCLLFTIFHC